MTPAYQYATATTPQLPPAVSPDPIEPRPPSPFNSVIFATDLSASSREVGGYAAQLARQLDTPLFVMHAFLPSPPARQEEAVSDAPSRQRTQLERLLARTLKQLEPPSRAKAVLIEGTPGASIRQISAQLAPSLVVLGARDRNPVDRCLFGSKAEQILRSIPAPVLTLGPRVASPTQLPTIRRILFATDFSPAATQAFSHAVSLAGLFRSEITVLHVAAAPAPELEATMEAFLQAASLAADPVLKLRPIFDFGSAADRILHHAHAEHHDLIVLGTHPHPTLAKHLQTSLTWRMIVEAECPVLTVFAG